MNKDIKGISNEALNYILNYKWPGNVRELENAIERAIVVGKNEIINFQDLPFHVENMNEEDSDRSLSALEKKYIQKQLDENKWNISKTAEILEIDRVTLYNKISKYKLIRKEKEK